jgi:hypothetical protein
MRRSVPALNAVPYDALTNLGQIRLSRLLHLPLKRGQLKLDCAEGPIFRHCEPRSGVGKTMKRREDAMSVIGTIVSRRTIWPVLACATLLFATGPVRAQEDAVAVAVSLGEVLGSEDFCGLKYDQGAVRNFMDKNVRKDDTEFTSTLRMVTGWTHYQDNSMSPSAKPAECDAIQRVARSYGFIR